MKYFTCVFSLLFLLFCSRVSTELVSWSSQTFSRSRYISATEGPNINVKDRTHGKSPLKIDRVMISPDNARPGDELTIFLVGYLFKTVDVGATVKIQVRVGSEAPVIKVYDLCSMLSDNSDRINLQCPIEEGPIKIVQRVKLRENIPEENILVMVTAYNWDRSLLASLIITADFSPSDLNEYLYLGN